MKKLNKLVFIDDDIHANEHHEIISRRAGVAHEILLFQGIDTALDYLACLTFRPKFPELIFINVHIPNGYKFIRQVRRFAGFDEDHTQLSYLITTLYNTDIAAFFKYNIKHFYFKPLNEINLVNAVRQIFMQSYKRV